MAVVFCFSFFGFRFLVASRFASRFWFLVVIATSSKFVLYLRAVSIRTDCSYRLSVPTVPYRYGVLLPFIRTDSTGRYNYNTVVLCTVRACVSVRFRAK